MIPRTIAPLALTCLVTVASCSDDNAVYDVFQPPDAGADIAVEVLEDLGTEEADAPSGDARVDLEDTPNQGDDVDEPPELPIGGLCHYNPDCASELCIFFEAGAELGFCSAYCADVSDCPEEGYECVRLANSGSDVVRVCIPTDLCIDQDGDGYGIGPGCEGPGAS